MKELNRRTFLAGTVAAAAGCASVPRMNAAPQKARRPNIVLIMADDMGYSDIGCYGGEIDTPNLDRLADGGVRFTQFYNNAKCAPTRASLLTGLYAHQVGCDSGPAVMRNCVTIAEALKDAGYRTLMAGKWHAQQIPTERGFDRYFGLADGCCNFFNPGEPRAGEPAPAHKTFPRRWSIDGEVFRPYTPEEPDFYTTDAFTDHACGYLDEYRGEGKPFFLYLAYTAPHYPLQAWPEDIAKYRGKYLCGWDEIRRQRRERMVNMGLIKEEWGLAPRDERVPPWEEADDLSKWDMEALKGRFSAESAVNRDEWDLKMAVYAAMVDRMDQNIGRVLAKLRELGHERDTLVMFLSDNGGCAESVHKTPDVPPGPVNSYRTVDAPWANAQNTPFRKYKRWDHEGGISTPLVAYWPGVIKPGSITHEVGHLIDIMATCLDIAEAPYPEEHHGEDIVPLEGKSLLPVLEGGTRQGHDTLCWEFGECRAVRQDKWKLVQVKGRPWELYDIEVDRTEMHNLAAEEAKRVEAMAAAWDAWAERCNVTY